MLFLKMFNYNNSPWMIESGMQVDTRPLSVNARELPAPSVIYKSGPLVSFLVDISCCTDLDLTERARRRMESDPPAALAARKDICLGGGEFRQS